MSAPDFNDFMLRARALSYDDYQVALHLLSVLGTGNISTSLVVTWRGATEGHFRGFAGVYIAKECLAGRLPSGEGFIAFVVAQGGPVPSGVLLPLASRTIGDVFDREKFPESKNGCLRVYFAPVDGTEARLAIDLITAVGISNVNPSLRDLYLRVQEQQAFAWFRPEVKSKGNLLRFLCEGTSCLVAP